LHDRFLASEIRRQRMWGVKPTLSGQQFKASGCTAMSRACIFAPFIETRNIKASFLRLYPILILSPARVAAVSALAPFDHRYVATTRLGRSTYLDGEN
jgi:hypothetical protein